MRPTFEHTVNVLVQAYLNDTLEHDDCAACAVGNIMASCGVVFGPDFNRAQWLRVIDIEVRRGSKNSAYVGGYDKEVGLQQIKATGYSMEELSKIEHAFEGDNEIFNALMAVVDVLAEIHNVDLSVKENA